MTRDCPSTKKYSCGCSVTTKPDRDRRALAVRRQKRMELSLRLRLRGGINDFYGTVGKCRDVRRRGDAKPRLTVPHVGSNDRGQAAAFSVSFAPVGNVQACL